MRYFYEIFSFKREYNSVFTCMNLNKKSKQGNSEIEIWARTQMTEFLSMNFMVACT